MILASFKSGREIRSIPPTFWPREATLDNYRAILDEPDLPLLRFYRNSAFVALANVASTLFTSSLLGYLLAKFEFRLNKPLFWFLLATLMVPAQVTMIPGYLLLSRLHLLNSLWGLVVPAAISAFGVFLMRQFCLSIPNSLIKAARVDGASEWRIFWSVILPQLKPALATLGPADVHGQLERLPLAADRAHRAGQPHAADHPHLVLQPERVAYEHHDGRCRVDRPSSRSRVRPRPTLDRARHHVHGPQVKAELR